MQGREGANCAMSACSDVGLGVMVFVRSGCGGGSGGPLGDGE